MHFVGEPSHGSDDCGYIRTGDYEWGDRPCDSTTEYVCETGCEYPSVQEIKNYWNDGVCNK